MSDVEALISKRHSRNLIAKTLNYLAEGEEGGMACSVCLVQSHVEHSRIRLEAVLDQIIADLRGSAN